MHGHIQKVVITERAIKKRTVEMPGEIAKAYARCEDGITVVTILAGLLIFLSDLIRLLPIKLGVGLVAVSSHSGRRIASRDARLILALLPDPRNRNVLIVDDIDIEDVLVVGYELDYDGLYRNLPFIGVLRSELYDTEA